MHALAAAVFGALAGGCRGQALPVVAPDGGPALALVCDGILDKCDEAASNACPSGYDSVPESGRRRLIRCRSVQPLPPQRPLVVAAQERVRSPAEVAGLALPDVASIKAIDAGGNVGQGSGFFITGELVATCLHVVNGASSIELSTREWSGKAVAVAGWSKTDDLAVLRVSPARLTAGLRISSRPIAVGSRILAISSPLGLEESVSDGVLSALRSNPEPRLQFTAPVSPGSSGGPILNETGEVVGVVAQILTAVRDGRTYGQNLNFAIPAERILPLAGSEHNVALEAFAEATRPEENLEEVIAPWQKVLTQELGEPIANALTSKMRDALSGKSADGRRPFDHAKEVRESRAGVQKLVQELNAEQLLHTAAEVHAKWTQWAIDGTNEHLEALKQTVDDADALLTVTKAERKRRQFPKQFAGFDFGTDYTSLYRYCSTDVADTEHIVCPSVPVRPYFTKGTAFLKFLKGALVEVAMDVSDYEEAVRSEEAKYGAYTLFLRWTGKSWSLASTKKISYAANTAFLWRLYGGRILVGRKNGAPFIVATHHDSDDAEEASY